jgi:hypothetical protein
MTVFSPTPEVSPFVFRVGSWAETHCCDFGLFDPKVQSSVLEVDDEYRSIGHLSVVDPDVMRADADMSAKHCKRVDMVMMVYLDIRAESRWPAIGICGIGIVF